MRTHINVNMIETKTKIKGRYYNIHGWIGKCVEEEYY